MKFESIDEVRASLALPPPAHQWLKSAIAAAYENPTSIRTSFPAVGRKIGRGEIADAGRVLLLDALGPRVLEELPDLYRFGDAAERRACLYALAFLPVGDEGLTYVRDAIRSNDTRLVIAALGPYALTRFDDDEVSQAVMKCVFMDIPLDSVDGLINRATPNTARMLAGFVHERVAAGRRITPEVWKVIDSFPPTAEIAAIEAELDSPVEARRNAAREALALRSPTFPL